jgi:hypothetical protein
LPSTLKPHLVFSSNSRVSTVKNFHSTNAGKNWKNWGRKGQLGYEATNCANSFRCEKNAYQRSLVSGPQKVIFWAWLSHEAVDCFAHSLLFLAEVMNICWLITSYPSLSQIPVFCAFLHFFNYLWFGIEEIPLHQETGCRTFAVW